MDWMIRRLIHIEHILKAKPRKNRHRLSKARRLIERRREILHERVAMHVWENEGGNIKDIETD